MASQIQRRYAMLVLGKYLVVYVHAAQGGCALWAMVDQQTSGLKLCQRWRYG